MNTSSIRYSEHREGEVGLYILERDLPEPKDKSKTKHQELIEKILEAYKQ